MWAEYPASSLESSREGPNGFLLPFKRTHPFPTGLPQYTNFPRERLDLKFKVFVSRRPLLKKVAFEKL